MCLSFVISDEIKGTSCSNFKDMVTKNNLPLNKKLKEVINVTRLKSLKLHFQYSTQTCMSIFLDQAVFH